MKPKGRRRRALLLLSLALASGGLAASQVSERIRGVEDQVGPLVPVVVAKRALRPDEELSPDGLAIREVPARFAPPDGLGTPGQAYGLRLAAPVAAGSYLTAGQLRGADRGRGGPVLRRGERAVELAVAGGDALATTPPGTSVDVLISTERAGGAGRTFLALEAVELLELRPGGGAVETPSGGEDDPGAASATARATLRVTARQAVYLTAAQNFAREVRLLPRPPGDGRRLGRSEVSGGGL